jgi:predicted phage tail component-like protein
MFTFNDIDFSTLNIKVSKIDRPLFAPQRLSTTSIEGKDEEIFHRKVSSSFNVEVEFYLFSNSGLALIADIRELAGMLDTSAPAKLIFHDESDKYVMAIVEETQIEKKNHYAIITVSFKVLDPYWYLLNETDIDYWSTGTKAIAREGNAQSYPVITIQATSSASGGIIVGANGSSMKYTGALLNGEKLIIDSALLTAYILKSDGVTKTSVLNKLDVLDFPVLNKGDNNFTIATSNGATLVKCTVKCNSRWK